jgi:hypothetical protein
VLAAAITAAGAIPGVALAQNNPAPAPNNPPRPAATEGRAQAPVGHRQPRPQDLPPDVQRDENGAGSIPGERGLDQKLQICRDC